MNHLLWMKTARRMSTTVYSYGGALVPMHFEQRVNRFVCKVKPADKEDAALEDIYCPNTGSMLNLVPSSERPSLPCCVSIYKGNSIRKYAKTLELVRDTDVWVGIQSRLANDMVSNALQKKLIPELIGATECNREVTVVASGENAKKKKDKDSRTDFQLIWRKQVQEVDVGGNEKNNAVESKSIDDIFGEFAFKDTSSDGLVSASSSSSSSAAASASASASATTVKAKKSDHSPITCNMLVEVKSVTLADNLDEPFGARRAVFPDCVSERASKHLRCLMDHKLSNPPINRSVVFFLIQRNDCGSFSPCHLDPIYTRLLGEAVEAGVEVLCYCVQLHPQTGLVSWERKVEYIANPMPELNRVDNENESSSAQVKRRKISKKKSTEDTTSSP